MKSKLEWDIAEAISVYHILEKKLSGTQINIPFVAGPTTRIAP